MAFARDLSVAKKRSLESASSGSFSKRGRGRGRVVVYTMEEGGVEAVQETAPGLVLSVVTWAT